MLVAQPPAFKEAAAAAFVLNCLRAEVETPMAAKPYDETGHMLVLYSLLALLSILRMTASLPRRAFAFASLAWTTLVDLCLPEAESSPRSLAARAALQGMPRAWSEPQMLLASCWVEAVTTVLVDTTSCLEAKPSLRQMAASTSISSTLVASPCARVARSSTRWPKVTGTVMCRLSSMSYR